MDPKPLSKIPSARMILLAAAAGIGGGFQLGFNMALINVPTEAVQEFMNATWLSRHGEAVSPAGLLLLWSLVVAAYTAGGLLGALLAGPLAVRVGRRNGLLASNSFVIAATVAVALSQPTGLFELLMVGRFLLGIDTGVGLSLQPMYVGECALQRQRGTLAMSTVVALTLGLLSAQILGLRQVMGEPHLWPLALSLPALPAALQLLLLPWLPESPRHLLLDRHEPRRAARRWPGSLHCSIATHSLTMVVVVVVLMKEVMVMMVVVVMVVMMKEVMVMMVAVITLASTSTPDYPALRWLRGGDGGDDGGESVEREMEQMEEERSVQVQARSVLDLLRDPRMRRQIVIIVGVNVMQQFSGINAIYFYASYLFKEAGIPPDEIRYVTVGTGMAELTSSIVCGILIESVGRRPLLMFGFASMGGCCLLIAVSMALQATISWMSYLSVAMTFTFIVSLGMGPAGIVGLLPTELFTQDARPAAYTISGSTYWVSFFVIGLLFPFLMKFMGPYCYLIFFADCVTASLLVFCLLPETKDRSFLDISRQLQQMSLGVNGGPAGGPTGGPTGGPAGGPPAATAGTAATRAIGAEEDAGTVSMLTRL
ncbi:solute carrier family 2, facilitated glucose transporter member 11-like [Petromyzon marinus]|uniref:solute carrier family 2, facilitated glucose transporter member 11-like n=1 Tax=Petromyzon marinus TaxID=7757 RepID=UPI003F7235AB